MTFRTIGQIGLVIAVATGVGCDQAKSGDHTAPGVRFKRIAVVGASVSAGFGGMKVADAIRAAAPGAEVIDVADVGMFRDPLGNGTAQIDHVLAAEPDLVIALDFLFWDEYLGWNQAERIRRLDRGLADLERVRTAGASLIVGDVPRFTNASELILSAKTVPPAADLEELNGRLRAWAALRDVAIVPFAAMCAPLDTDGEIEVTPGEPVRARELMSLDGLHPNIYGMWYVMTQIDRLVETRFGVAPDAWTFARPK